MGRIYNYHDYSLGKYQDEDLSRSVQIGDRFKLLGGEVIEIVPYIQSKQTRGFWLAVHTHDRNTPGLKFTGTSGYSVSGFINDYARAYDNSEQFCWYVSGMPVEQERLKAGFCVCTASEVDAKENEFGLISP